jgi:hypothetical protein
MDTPIERIVIIALVLGICVIMVMLATGCQMPLRTGG